MKTIKCILYYTLIPLMISILKLREKTNTAYTVDHLDNLAFNYNLPPLGKLSVKPTQVKKDFKMYSPLRRKSGIIAFHGICLHLPEIRCEVIDFWNEIKHKYRYREIVKIRTKNWLK